MSDDDQFRHDAPHLIEQVVGEDGKVRFQAHGSTCPRTQQVVRAMQRGEMPPHPDAPNAARCGPAMVNSDAYREGWETLFGKKTIVGVA